MAKKTSGDGEQQVQQAIEWYAGADSSAEGIADWDIKTQQFAEAIQKILASGCGIMFGTTMDGGAVSVTIYQNQKKVRKYLTDSIELDDWSDQILRVYMARVQREVPAKAAAESKTAEGKK